MRRESGVSGELGVERRQPNKCYDQGSRLEARVRSTRVESRRVESSRVEIELEVEVEVEIELS